MKAFYVLFGLVLLASCTNTAQKIDDGGVEAPVVTEESVISESVVEPEIKEEEDDTTASNELLKSIDVATEEIKDMKKDESKTSKVEASYNNPKGLVDMVVNYSLDSDGKITAISVSATTYNGLGDFNTGIQSLIGKSLEEASKYTSGSSLTGPAFTQALKSQL